MSGKKKEKNIIEEADDQDLKDFAIYLKALRGYSEDTVSSYSFDIASFLLFLKENNITKKNVTKEDIRAFILEDTNKGLSRVSIKRRIAALRHFYNYLCRYKEFDKNPFETITVRKTPKKLPKFFTQNEIDDLLDSNKRREGVLATRDKAMIDLIYFSGLRASETCNARIGDIDLSSRIIRVKGKGNKEREVPFTRECQKAIEEYLIKGRPVLSKRGEEKEDYLFLNNRGRKLTVRGLEYIVKSAAQKSGFTLKIHPHMLRHSFATEMLNNKTDLRVIQELLGHSSINTTSIYTHVTYGDLKETYKRCFPDRLGGKMKKRGVIFDFNGTMFFDEDKHILSWKEFAKLKFGYVLKDNEFIDHIHGHSNDEILHYMTGKKFTPDEVLELAKEKEEMYQKLCEDDSKNLHLVDGLPEFLTSLKNEGISLAIATASMKPNVDWYIKTFDLLKWFDIENIIYDDGTLEKGKPDPMIYLRAMDKINTSGEETVIFEDALSGIRSARASKARYVVEVDDIRRKDKPDVADLVDFKIHDFNNLPSDLLSFVFDK